MTGDHLFVKSETKTKQTLIKYFLKRVVNQNVNYKVETKHFCLKMVPNFSLTCQSGVCSSVFNSYKEGTIFHFDLGDRYF